MQKKIENFALLKQQKPSKFKFNELVKQFIYGFFLEFIDFFLEVRGVGWEVDKGSVLGDGVAATGGEILVDGALWDGVAIVGGLE